MARRVRLRLAARRRRPLHLRSSAASPAALRPHRCPPADRSRAEADRRTGQPGRFRHDLAARHVCDPGRSAGARSDRRHGRRFPALALVPAAAARGAYGVLDRRTEARRRRARARLAAPGLHTLRRVLPVGAVLPVRDRSGDVGQRRGRRRGTEVGPRRRTSGPRGGRSPGARFRRRGELGVGRHLSAQRAARRAAGGSRAGGALVASAPAMGAVPARGRTGGTRADHRAADVTGAPSSRTLDFVRSPTTSR